MISSDHIPVAAYLEDKVSKRRGQFKRWIGHDGLLESIGRGWVKSGKDSTEEFVMKLSDYRHQNCPMEKEHPPYGKEKISELQQALEEVQSDNSRTQEETMEI